VRVRAGKILAVPRRLFATQDKWAELPMPSMLLDSLAGAVGLDKTEWKKCVDSGKMKPLIMADRDRAAAAEFNRRRRSCSATDDAGLTTAVCDEGHAGF
jgi:hypothetical protein